MKYIAQAAIIAVTAVAFTVGSVVPSDAKAKKKAAAAAPTPAVCWFTPNKPVCGVKGGMQFTFVNSCIAVKDGAKVASEGACKPAKAKKAGKKKMSKKK